MLVLIRHGETEHNKKRIWQGQLDTELSITGKQQVEALAKRLANWNISQIHSSDLKRAKATAQAVNVHHNLTIDVHKNLREIHLGQWQGYTMEQVKEKYPQEYQQWLSDIFSGVRPGGESNEQMLKRVRSHVDKIWSEFNEEMMVVVAHGLAIRTLVVDLLNLDHSYVNRIHLDNTGIIRMKEVDGRWVLLSLNDTAHLDC